MSHYKNEGLDDPVLDDGQAQWGGGQRSYASDEALGPDEYALAVNMDVDKLGVIQSRRGTLQNIDLSSVAAGTGNPNVPRTNVNAFLPRIASANPSIDASLLDGKFVNYAGATSTLIDFADADADPISAEEFNNMVVLSKYGEEMMRFNPLASPSVASLGEGAFADSQPTDPPSANFICVHGNRLVAAGSFDYPTTIWFSDVLDVESWDWTKGSLAPHGRKTDPVTGIISWINSLLFVGCKNSLWIVQADEQLYDATTGVAGWRIDRVGANIGLASHFTLARVGDRIFGLFTDGVRAISRNDLDTLSSATLPLSEPIQDVIDRISWQYAYRSVGAYFDGKYFISIPIDESETPNKLLVWSELRSCWVGEWNIDAQAIRALFTSGLDRLFIGVRTSDVRVANTYPAEFDPSTHYIDQAGSDAESEYLSSVTTRAFDFGLPDEPKQGLSVEVTFRGSLGDAAVIAIYDQDIEYILNPNTATAWLDESGQIVTDETDEEIIEEDVYELADTSLGATTRMRYDLMAYGTFREIQIRVAGYGKIAVAKVRVHAFADTMPCE